MLIKDAFDAYYVKSGKASDAARQLALAGIALLWIFKVDDGHGNLRMPVALLFPALFLVLALAFDLCQYAIGSMIWWCYARRREKRGQVEDAKAPASINYAEFSLFYGKITLVIAAYLFLLRFVLQRLWAS